ncbi:MAG: SMC-Scp complex subunit ScpB [Rickettsiales bacterium]|nr:SMC-Scp complex subunit ScpB [Rickettsiales bacterium]|tara:strand:- start:54 stop:581 length:528 start_codon:yes stop_codon:yes gene_type:complete
MKFSEARKLVEALIFSSHDALSEKKINQILSKHGKFDLKKIIKILVDDYKDRGINLECIEKKWFFKTTNEISDFLRIETEKKRKLSQSTMETLAIISYHQPVTRAEIEKIRGKSVFRGTLDILLNLKWIKPQGRRETPGRPVTWVTDYEFLRHFGLNTINDLPKVEELESIKFEN